MQELIVDPALRAFLPRQGEEELATLEQSLLDDKLRDAIIVWKGENIIVDGMTRYTFCRKHGIPYEHKIEYHEFANREEVEIWMLKTQLGRRNLNKIQQKYFRGRYYNARKAASPGRPVGNVAAKGSTGDRVGNKDGVSARTVLKDAKFAGALDAAAEALPEIKSLVLAGKLKMTMSVLTAELSSIAKLTTTDAKKRLEDIVTGKPQTSPNEVEDGTISALESRTELQEEAERVRRNPGVKYGDKLSGNGVHDFYPLVREPRQEQDVVALFSMALARGLFPYEILSVSSSYRYDCFLQFTNRKKNHVIVAEFKYRGESILRDLANRKEKARYGQFDLIICWTMNERSLRDKGFRIEKANQNDLPGATHVLSIPIASGIKDSPIAVICLSQVLKQAD